MDFQVFEDSLRHLPLEIMEWQGFFEDSLRQSPLEIMKIQGFPGFPKAFPFRNHGISRFFEDFLRHLPLEIMKIQRIFFGNPDLSPFESTELWKEINCFERNKLFVKNNLLLKNNLYLSLRESDSWKLFWKTIRKKNLFWVSSREVDNWKDFISGTPV